MSPTALRDDYRGPFDPELTLGDFSRDALSRLGREFLLAGHLQDRVALPRVFLGLGEEAQTRSAIEEWMCASPIYSGRMQRAMGFAGSDVATTFKNLQLDIGAPHQFMDFHFRLDSPQQGEFWLAHCGALMDVEPFGETHVRRMCHDIEDPTFDATAAATNPLLKMRPVHRPPRVPADRYPHCRWRVFLDASSAGSEPHPGLEAVRRSRIAELPIEGLRDDAEPGGWRDYSGPFDPDFQLEDLSHGALVTVLHEFAVQSRLLTRSLLLSLTRHHGEAWAREIATQQWTGIGGLTAQRLSAALRIEEDGIEDVAKLFQIHPAFFPRRYVDLRVELTGPRSARLTLGECPAFREDDGCSWYAQLGAQPHPALDAIAAAVNPRARCRPVEAAGSALAWEVAIDPDRPPLPEPDDVRLAKLSRGAGFVFERRRPLRR